MFNDFENQIIGYGYKTVKRIVDDFSFFNRCFNHAIMLNLYKRCLLYDVHTIIGAIHALLLNSDAHLYQIIQAQNGILAKVTIAAVYC